MGMGMIYMCIDSKTASSTLLLGATLHIQLHGVIPLIRHTGFSAAPSQSAVAALCCADVALCSYLTKKSPQCKKRVFIVLRHF